MANPGNELALKAEPVTAPGRPAVARLRVVEAPPAPPAGAPPRERLRLLAGGLLALLVLAAVTWLVTELRDQPVTSVRVAGDFVHVRRRALEAAVAPFITGSFFDVDVQAVRRAALSLPWVRGASVRRVWPGSIHVAVVERVPAYRWNEHGLLEADGALFRPATRAGFDALPLLQGPPGTQHTVLARYLAFRRVLAPTGQHIRRLRMSERGAWRAVLGSGVLLVLGRDPGTAELARFARAFGAVFRNHMDEVERVDLRYANGFAVRWKKPTPEAPPKG